MDPSELLRAAAPVTQAAADMDDPRQHVAWALGSFPAPNKSMGDVPIHPAVQGDLSQRLHEFGYRHQPELQTKWVLPGERPESGYLNVPRIVDRKEYDAYQAAHADPDAEAANWRSTAEALLGKLDPKLLNRINSLTDDERAAAAAVQRQQLPAAFERLAQLHDAVRQQNDQQEGDGS